MVVFLRINEFIIDNNKYRCLSHRASMFPVHVNVVSTYQITLSAKQSFFYQNLCSTSLLIRHKQVYNLCYYNYNTSRSNYDGLGNIDV